MGLSVGAPCVECVNFGEWETCASPAQATPDSPWLLVRMARGNEQRRLSNGQFIDGKGTNFGEGPSPYRWLFELDRHADPTILL